MNINTFKNILSLKEQRENLLKSNNDLIFGVYELKKISENKIVLENREEILCCYPNQYKNLKGLQDNEDILIIDLLALRKGEIKPLNNIKTNHKNLVLLSNGVIEVVKSEYKDKNGEIKQRNHFPTTLRDGGAADKNQRTSVSGRNTGNNLFKDLEREYTEESPFLGKKEDGNYYLFTPENKNKDLVTKVLIKSIEFFLKNKYNLDRNNPKHLESIKIMERSLRIKYEDLGKILKEIIKNKRIVFFESNNLENFKLVSDDFKEIKIIDYKGKKLSKGNFFVYFDKENNTIEYRVLREIKIPKGVRATSRLFLESQNQGTKNSRLENLIQEELVPTIKYFIKKIIK